MHEVLGAGVRSSIRQHPCCSTHAAIWTRLPSPRMAALLPPVLHCGPPPCMFPPLTCRGNRLGELGKGVQGLITDSPQLDPAPVAGGHLFVDLHCSNYFSCARTAEGEAWCWGVSGLGGGLPVADRWESPLELCTAQPALWHALCWPSAEQEQELARHPSALTPA
jgi:hypothetical protein